MQKQGKAPHQVISKLQGQREKNDVSGPSPATVYKFLAGATHKRAAEETRGRPSKVPVGLVRTANVERLKLIRKADYQYLVTWGDIHKATKKALQAHGRLMGGSRMPSEDYLARRVRNESDVRARPGKRRITRTKEDEENRHKKAITWAKYPQTFWEEDVHFIDTKKFVCPRNEKDVKLLRTTRITHHLRSPAEGSQKEFILPKKGHMLLGIPSIEVTAAVGRGRVLLWHVSTKPWNGEKAKLMYGKLGEVLRKRYGIGGRFRVVEDGDTKGFQSGKGKAAKKAARITSFKLPPRTPSWMPWDFSLWDEIERRVLSKPFKGAMSAKVYAKRLSLTALRLPPRVVKNCLAKMKDNIVATKKAKGGRNGLD